MCPALASEEPDVRLVSKGYQMKGPSPAKTQILSGLAARFWRNVKKVPNRRLQGLDTGEIGFRDFFSEFMLAVAMSRCRCGFSAGMNPINERSVKRVSNEAR